VVTRIDDVLLERKPLVNQGVRVEISTGAAKESFAEERWAHLVRVPLNVVFPGGRKRLFVGAALTPREVR